MGFRNMKPDQLHSYGLLRRIVQYLVLLPSTAAFSLISGGSLIALLVHLFRPAFPTTLGVLDLFGGVLFPGIGVCLALMAVNLQPEIRLSSDGIGLRAFFFWWMFVPWKEVCSMERPVALPWSRSRLVFVDRLTFFHRLGGWTFGHRFEPAFLILPDLRGFDEVIDTIEQHLSRRDSQ